MALNIAREVAVMERMTVGELRTKYGEVFGEATHVGNKPWLIKRIAWRLQSLAEGGLSERARQRAAELANDADVRMTPPKVKTNETTSETRVATTATEGDKRVPLPGTTLLREYKGQSLQVKVLAKGFLFEGETYKSLSAVAKKITGQHCNGYFFFRLGEERGAK